MAMLCVFPWDESLEEEKRREGKEGEKLFETGKWRLLPTPTALWSFCFPSELGTGEDGTADLNTWKGKQI